MVNSGEIPFFIASRTCCVPDSTPNQTEKHPDDFIFARRDGVSMSTRVPQINTILMQTRVANECYLVCFAVVLDTDPTIVVAERRQECNDDGITSCASFD